MESMQQLLSAERKLFDCLREYLFVYGYSPSIGDLKKMWEEPSSSKTQQVLRQLRAKGYVDWDRNKPRTYRLTAGNIPLQGVIQAGYVFEQPVFSAYVDVPNMQYRLQDYALEVRGDSMKEAQICDGDLVILRPIQQIDSLKPGTITAVWVEDEVGTTLKHIFHDGDHVLLQPANREYESRRYLSHHVHPQGMFVGLHRSYSR